MEVFFFGHAQHPLFGVFESDSGSSGSTGVVIAQPVGHEYIPSYPSVKRLSKRLVESGFPVLRFDYQGSGDSSGEYGEGDLEVWQGDLVTAIDELKAQTHVPKVILIGLRLGASMALEVAAKRTDVQQLVLWEPIVCGTRYYDELRALQAAFLRTRSPPLPGRSESGDGELKDVMGFPLLPEFLQSLRSLDLLRSSSAPDKILLIGSSPDSALVAQLGRLGCEVDLKMTSSEAFWLKPDGDGAIVQEQTLTAIVDWIVGQIEARSWEQL